MFCRFKLDYWHGEKQTLSAKNVIFENNEILNSVKEHKFEIVRNYKALHVEKITNWFPSRQMYIIQVQEAIINSYMYM